MNYSDIYGAKSILPTNLSILPDTNNHSWDPYSFNVGGNRIIVEGGNVESIETDSSSNIIRVKVTPTIKYAYGQTGSVFDPPKTVTFDCRSLHIRPMKNEFEIKKIQINPKKNATTVIFEDGKVVVVKKHDGDPDVDLLSVVAYAIAEKVYGSNSAFKREVKGKVERMKE